ncbi:Hypothetical protein FKW44_020784 [Caligus rogercresseyi]|uniref:Uncharacterized protein n=1 Tax=Caligus rogercresseyi TaxID=217165 RepID=A0A7T8JUT9_CALRO|nr:Hypothetical protein FKW44_020784 [Caligus rogercresseyi]
MPSSARYSALAARIPDLSGTNWNYAGDTLRFYSNGSKVSLRFLRRLLRLSNGFRRIRQENFIDF